MNADYVIGFDLTADRLSAFFPLPGLSKALVVALSDQPPYLVAHKKYF